MLDPMEAYIAGMTDLRVVTSRANFNINRGSLKREDLQAFIDRELQCAMSARIEKGEIPPFPPSVDSGVSRLPAEAMVQRA